jgi:hypothetical protein
MQQSLAENWQCEIKRLSGEIRLVPGLPARDAGSDVR